MTSTTLSLLVAVLGAALVSAHTIIVYPGWRGDNLVTNATFPYGMQWMYPCGGMKLTTNRTFWPIGGGAVSFQPGWFQGHATAQLFINMGFGTDGPDGGPGNMSNVMVSQFGITGPSKNPYPGTICLPQVPLPANANAKVGDNATIQVVELAVHGASLFSCVDITLVDNDDPRLNPVNETNCFNSTDIGFSTLYTIATKVATNITSSAGAPSTARGSLAVSWLPLLVAGLWLLL
ncbi:hypothetical protein CMQ_1809 [Grosmannia clavigera kw1407]|uniref:Copper acquisition factor BIM1-like domain-containing protein n=1 Tax=Grosmannia clavigera (strain kw1407 / UAMH 11150) TaxID=655863 RepID=F0XB08_GROCL|nr:uncharacterized protein CMQ_1809 [Grosmannia clavigera kw1407]EFX05173.1 hypothetical protein CMQ_1809 [Grosmannia clavigera kw1407]